MLGMAKTCEKLLFTTQDMPAMLLTQMAIT